MPGRLLKMTTNGVEGADHVVNGKQSLPGAVQPANESSIPGLGKRASDNALVNGDSHLPGLGAYPTPNGVSPSSPAKTALPDSMYDLPEEVVHITTGVHSLGALIQRVSAQCFNELEATVDQLARLPLQIPSPMANGAGGIHQTPTLSGKDEERNKQKKGLILKFASDFRAKFIKLLVLTDWAKRDQKDVSKLIDLKNWLVVQDDAALQAGNWFYNIIKDLRSFKLANPDLETALAVLSKGDVPWLPHLDFREQKALSPESTLKVLRQMNAIINLRLVLHEELIPQLRDYRVANGRATFTFPQEFELDVYVASEDPEQPWYFLDVRFLFEPAPQMKGERLRAVVDSRMNMALAENGLKGACELAHDFVLTHKINILRKQAQELQRGIWASSLNVDMIRRTLVVQYWTESPQPKSWIEIGIATGKDKSRRRKADNAISSQVKTRWIRNGKEQKDVEVPIDLANLSLERLLSAYIARHSSHLLESVQEGLETQALNLAHGEERLLKIDLTTSETEPADCVLRARIGGHPTTALQIDGITGRLYFSPAGIATPKAQEALERAKDPATEAPATLLRYLTYDIQLRLERLIDNLGWEAMRHLKITRDDISRRTKREALRFGLYQPRSFKGSHWYIMFTINLCGESWWVLEFDPSSPSNANADVACSRLKVPGTGDLLAPLSVQTLKKLEQSAISASSYIAANRDLTARGVSTAIRHVPIDLSKTPLASSFKSSTAEKTLPTLMIRFSQLLRSTRQGFANDLLQLQYLSFDTDLGQVRLVAKGRMRDPAKVQDVLQKTKDSNVAFSPDGSFSMLLSAKVGVSVVPTIVARLNTLNTLCHFAKILRRSGFECKTISFSKVCFRFAQDQEITLVFAGTEEDPRIKLEIARDNPHRRVAPLLEEIVNDPEMGFERFVLALDYFHPVLRAFQRLEQKHALDYPAAPIIHPRQVDFYRLLYPNPNNPKEPYVIFDLSFKRNKDDLEWRIAEFSNQNAKLEREKVFPNIEAKLSEFMKRVGTGWTGMRSMIIAPHKGGIEEAILELDRCVWDAMGRGTISHSRDGKGIGQDVITID
ncbi:uncharacterized protein PV09_05925 [Verruconis gallopava]|uniref:Mediator of RNA polymerase II transcription subunit 14 n=1 Tax=Verruconis gallopava TaxID=253628 RepID=A0A0D2AUP4_9PEZI|nr:uncharacterized protein PV09_05925 [Verruconis gallopava]KIW02874.1 hypothetical protein PV09_05925 [Verruconis gallopava]